MKFLKFLEGLGISQWITQSDFGYPIMLTFHSIGLAAVVGITAMMALRVLGFAKAVPPSGFARLAPFAVAGFIINAASGVLLFMADGTRLIGNWAFLLKMLAVVVGGIAFALMSRELKLEEFRDALGGDIAIAEPTITTKMRTVACIILGAWLVAIVAGRLIAYVIDAAELGH